MTPNEILDIAEGAKDLSPVERAKLYNEHIHKMFEEIKRLEKTILEFERQSSDKNSDLVAQKTIIEILNTLADNGYAGFFMPTA